MEVTQNLVIDLANKKAPQAVYAVQGDSGTRVLEIEMKSNGTPWPIPQDAAVMVHYQRCKDGSGGTYDTMPDGTRAWTVSGNVLTLLLAPQVCSSNGYVLMELTFLRQDDQLTTFHFIVHVSGSIGELEEDGDYTNLSDWLANWMSVHSGYYTPQVTQPDDDTMNISFVPSKAGMDEVSDAEVKLPAGPQGPPPSAEQVRGAVDTWLAEHPEAVTTVQDGAVTAPKLATESVSPAKTKGFLEWDSYVPEGTQEIEHEVPNYTNIFPECRYTLDTYMSSSAPRGQYAAKAGCFSIHAISASSGDVIRLKGVTIASDLALSRFRLSDDTAYACINAGGGAGWSDRVTVESDGTIKFTTKAIGQIATPKYVEFCFKTPTDLSSVIITKNQEIKTRTETEVIQVAEHYEGLRLKEEVSVPRLDGVERRIASLEAAEPNSDSLPAYAVDEFNTTIHTLQSLVKPNAFSFGYISDLHFSSDNSEYVEDQLRPPAIHATKALRKLSKQFPLTCVCFGGDTMQNGTSAGGYNDKQHGLDNLMEVNEWLSDITRAGIDKVAALNTNNYPWVICRHAGISGGEVMADAKATVDYIKGKNQEIICLMAGHAHSDWKLDYNGVPIISNVGAGFWAIRENQDGTTYERKLGTASETAFTVVTIDKDAKKIYLTRYGAGADREFGY